MLAVHGGIDILTTLVGFAQLATAVVHRRPAGGPAWPALAGLEIAIADLMQVYLGFDRITGLFIPIGVTLVVAAALLAVWVWLPGAGLSFRNDIVNGPGDQQILPQDPAGNVVELFQPATR